MSKNDSKLDIGQAIQALFRLQRHDAQRQKSDKLKEQIDNRNEQSNRYYEELTEELARKRQTAPTHITDKQPILRKPPVRTTGEQQRLSLSSDPLRQSVDQMLTRVQAAQAGTPPQVPDISQQETQDMTGLRQNMEEMIARIEATRKRQEMHIARLKTLNYQLAPLPVPRAPLSDEDDIARWATQLVPTVVRNPITPLPIATESRPEITEIETPQRRIEYRITEKKLLRERLLAASLYYCCKYEKRPDAILMSPDNYNLVLPILKCRPSYKFGYPLDDAGVITIPYGVDETLDDQTIACIGSPNSTDKLPETK
jgi:hypothetical protein